MSFFNRVDFTPFLPAKCTAIGTSPRVSKFPPSSGSHCRFKRDLHFLQTTLNRAYLFASQSKLAEIFFESVPQLLTQLSMTCAKGEEGTRKLSDWQKLSVIGSAITIALGISGKVVEDPCFDCGFRIVGGGINGSGGKKREEGLDG